MKEAAASHQKPQQRGAQQRGTKQAHGAVATQAQGTVVYASGQGDETGAAVSQQQQDMPVYAVPFSNSAGTSSTNGIVYMQDGDLQQIRSVACPLVHAHA